MATIDLSVGQRPSVVALLRRHDGFPYPVAVAASLALAALTLSFAPARLGYDPWSWLVWGRELDHLTLSVRGSGSAFKPLAALVGALVAPFGRGAPIVWLALVRGAMLLSLALAFHVARRRHGIVAGVLAALAVATIHELTPVLALHGMAEPVQACLCLAALERGLAGRDLAAAGCLVAASLLEAVLVVALVLYGVVLVVRAERRLAVAAGLAGVVVLVGCAWVLPGLLAGHGALHAEARAAATPIAGGPLRARLPGVATVRELHSMLLWPLALGWLGELLLGAVAVVRRRVVRALFVACVIAALVVVSVAVAAQLQLVTATDRFLAAPCAVGAVAAVCLWAQGAGRLAAWIRSGSPIGSRRIVRGPRLSGLLAAAAAPVLLLAVLALVEPGVRAWERSVRHDVKHSRPGADAEAQLPDVVRAVGGAGRLLACGRIYSGAYEIPEVAWTLGVPARRIWHGPMRRGAGTTVTLEGAPVATPDPRKLWMLSGGPSDDSGWQVSSTCL